MDRWMVYVLGIVTGVCISVLFIRHLLNRSNENTMQELQSELKAAQNKWVEDHQSQYEEALEKINSERAALSNERYELELEKAEWEQRTRSLKSESEEIENRVVAKALDDIRFALLRSTK